MTVLLASIFSVFLSFHGAEEPEELSYPQYYISGIVYSGSGEKHGNIPLEGAVVELISLKDTSRTTTSKAGRFSFSFDECFEATLKISCLGYKTHIESYQLDQPSTVIAVEMIPEVENIDAAVVKGEIPFMTKDADTTTFNTAAIGKMEGDAAMKLLESIPGFEFRNGTIYFEGEEVRKTYVNGKLIFGDSSLSALALLGAEEVKSVNIYDQQSALDKHRGKKNSKKERVINLKTFKEFASASDLMVQARTGFGGAGGNSGNIPVRYSAGLHHSYNSEMLQSVIEMNSNNICDDSNSPNTVLRPDKIIDADVTHHGAEIIFNKKWKDAEWGNSLGGYYSLKSDKENRSFLKTIDRIDGLSGKEAGRYTESSSTDNTSRLHHLTLSGDFNDTPLKSIIVGTELSFSDQKTVSLEQIASSSSSLGARSQNQIRKDSHRDYSFSPSFVWSDPDMKNGWMPLIKMACNTGHSDDRLFNLDTLSSSYNKRYIQGGGNGFSKSFEGSVAISKKKEVNEHLTTEKEFVLCEMSHMNFSIDKLTIDRLVTPESGLDSIDVTNSCKYTWNDTKFSSGFKYYAFAPGLIFSFVTGISYLRQKDDECFPAIEHEFRDYVMPAFSFASLELHLKGNRLVSSFSVQSDVPSIEQTRERITNTNPLRLQIGNPDLDKSSTRSFAMNFFSKTFSKGNSFSIQLLLENKKNAIVDKVQYFPNIGSVNAWGTQYSVPAGATLTSYENADGTRRLSFDSKYSMRVKALRGKLSTGLSFNSFRTPQYDGDVLNRITSNSPSFNVSLITMPVSNILRLSLTGGLSYLNEKNNSGIILAEALTENVKASSEVRFMKNTFWDTSYSCSLIRYRSGSGLDTDFHNLSSAIGYMFMDGRMGVSISGSNLLNKATNYTSSSTSSEFTQIWRRTFGRCFLLNLTYRVKDRR